MANILGLDLGTSSIKALLLRGCETAEWSVPYTAPGPAGLEAAAREAVFRASEHIPLAKLDSVGLSGQTGTYYLFDSALAPRYTIQWHEAGREDALREALSMLPQAEFVRLIGMAHPPLASYPLPTLIHLRRTCPPRPGDTLMQPKDYLCRLLCGEALSDAGSWRGLYNSRRLEYAGALLSAAGISRDALPRVSEYGRISESGARAFGLLAGMPVAVGFNDFYSALYGMRVAETYLRFDVTGTSEHVGLTLPNLAETPFVSAPYRDIYVNYGVTAASGVSLAWGRSLFGAGEPPVPRKAPLFLPYLRGERAPVFDSDARGMFMGLDAGCDAEVLRYSVLEGVAFSVFDVYSRLNAGSAPAVHATGGACAGTLLNRLKAALFNAPIMIEPVLCGSALGALRAAGGELSVSAIAVAPEKKLRDYLMPRYEAYRSLYPVWRAFSARHRADKLFY